MKTFLHAFIGLALFGWFLFGLAAMTSNDAEKDHYRSRVAHYEIMATLAAGFLYLGRKEKE